MKRMSEEKRQELKQKIEQAIASGSTQQDACKKYGVKTPTYASWKKAQGSVVTYDGSKPKVIRRPKKQTNDKIVALVGTPNEVLTAVRSLMGQP